MIKPTTNPVNPEANVWVETLNSVLRINRIGRVVK